MPVPTAADLRLPPWIADFVDSSRPFADDDAKVGVAIELSRRNVEAGTGGPFGAVVFGPDDRIAAVGVNFVMALGSSIAHAETLALVLAQRAVGRPRLNRDVAGHPAGPYTLAASAQPCCQCYGAVIWAGIDRLIIGARTEDVTSLTSFDEGPLPTDWRGELRKRDILVICDVRRDAARDVLRAYTAADGPSY